MENAVLKVLAERCGNIRWKGMFIDTQPDPVADQESHDHICWCVFTQSVIGPDGQTVAEDTCNATRSCFQAV
jgi:hypothetical protein